MRMYKNPKQHHAASSRAILWCFIPPRKYWRLLFANVMAEPPTECIWPGFGQDSLDWPWAWARSPVPRSCCYSLGPLSLPTHVAARLAPGGIWTSDPCTFKGLFFFFKLSRLDFFLTCHSFWNTVPRCYFGNVVLFFANWNRSEHALWSLYLMFSSSTLVHLQGPSSPWCRSCLLPSPEHNRWGEEVRNPFIYVTLPLSVD